MSGATFQALSSYGSILKVNASVTTATSQYMGRNIGTMTSSLLNTIAFWIKPTSANPSGVFVASGTFNNVGIGFSSTTINIGSSNFATVTNAITIDAAWHFVCIRYDSAQATASNRVVIEYDGVNVTNVGGSTYPALNAVNELYVTSSGTYFGTYINAGPRLGFPGKIAQVYLIDGQSQPSSAFTTGTGAGTIHPIKYSGTFGAQGSYISFSNNSGLGNDDGTGAQGSHAGSNDFTNISLVQSTSDVPT